MANQDAAFGFRPVRSLTGGQIRTEEANIANNYDTAIYTGQVVEAVTAGGVEAATVGDVQQAGVFGGVFYTDPTTSKPTWKAYYPASTAAADIKATIYMDPTIIFEAQHDGTGTAAHNFASGLFVGVAGSTATGQSTQELDTSTFTTTAEGFKQIGISKDPDNSDESADNANAYVVFGTGENVFTFKTGI
jgi:hypothetical protein